MDRTWFHLNLKTRFLKRFLYGELGLVHVDSLCPIIGSWLDPLSALRRARPPQTERTERSDPIFQTFRFLCFYFPSISPYPAPSLLWPSFQLKSIWIWDGGSPFFSRNWRITTEMMKRQKVDESRLTYRSTLCPMRNPPYPCWLPDIVLPDMERNSSIQFSSISGSGVGGLWRCNFSFYLNTVVIV